MITFQNIACIPTDKLSSSCARESASFRGFFWLLPAKKKARPIGQALFLVDATRENWNGIFEEIVRLSEKLEKLGIDGIMETDDV